MFILFWKQFNYYQLTSRNCLSNKSFKDSFQKGAIFFENLTSNVLHFRRKRFEKFSFQSSDKVLQLGEHGVQLPLLCLAISKFVLSSCLLWASFTWLTLRPCIMEKLTNSRMMTRQISRMRADENSQFWKLLKIIDKFDDDEFSEIDRFHRWELMRIQNFGK